MGSCFSSDKEKKQDHHQEEEDNESTQQSEEEEEMNWEEMSGSLMTSSDPSTQLTILTQICDALCYAAEGSISDHSAQSLSPVLVALARQDDDDASPDIILYAIRAITYLCDASPNFLVDQDVLSVLSAPLLAIQFMDVSEQCLQALEKISRTQPLPLAFIMPILTCFHFLSNTYQRVGVTVIANICKKLPSDNDDSSPQLMEALPVLCNLLQYEDHKIVESVATCFINIVKKSSHSLEMLDQLCKHGLVGQVAHLIAFNSGNNLSHSVYNGLIGLLSQLASASPTASNTLFELDIISTLKNIICGYDISHSKTYSTVDTDAHHDQIHEVAKLLNALLPPFPTNGKDKERFLTHQPELLQQFGEEILPVLVQVVNSGADLYVSYGFLSIINKIVHFSKSNMPVDLLKNNNIASFLAGLLAQKDQHLLTLSLRIVKNILQEVSEVFLNSFIKEGLVHGIRELATLKKCSPSILRKSSNTQEAIECLCYAYNIDHPSSSEIKTCKLTKSSVQTLANHITTTYFSTGSQYSEFASTSVLQKLRNLCATLSETVNMSVKDKLEQERKLTHILGQMMEEFNGEESVSTFEFIESGVARALLLYLSNGCYQNGKLDAHDLSNHLDLLQKRFEVFARFCLPSTSHDWRGMPLAVLVKKLQSTLPSLENFPVILHHDSEPRESTDITIPVERSTTRPCLRVRLTKEKGDATLIDYTSDVVNVDAFTSMNAIEKYLWPKVRSKHTTKSARKSKIRRKCKATVSNSPSTSESDPGGKTNMSPNSGNDTQRLMFYLDGKQLDQTLTLYQAILQLKTKSGNDLIVGPNFWDNVYEISYRKWIGKDQPNIQDVHHKSEIPTAWNHPQIFWQNALCFSNMLFGELPSSFEKSNPVYEILVLLKVLEGMNKSAPNLMLCERSKVFAEGHNNTLDSSVVKLGRIPQTEFVCLKLSEKFEQQMQEALVPSTGSLPSWCVQLMESFPFLFSFQVRRRYFHFTLYPSASASPSSSSSSSSSHESVHKKFQVCRSRILESAAQMMASNLDHRSILEVEYPEEVGTGLGPIMEFFTLVSKEFQKVGLGMWREDNASIGSENGLKVESSGYVVSPSGLFPRPWADVPSNEKQISKVLENFVLLGQVVAKALHDGRFMDLPLSVSFYKLILEQELNLYDIISFDIGLGSSLIEFQALVERQKILCSSFGKSKPVKSEIYFHDTRIEDLSLDFTLPGYPDFMLRSAHDQQMVDKSNLEEYISLTADATVKSGILRQAEAFKSGFNQVLPLRSLQIFTEEELDQLLCGEPNAWSYNELLDHIKFDHGYTSSSPSIIHFLEILQEFDGNEQRAFLQFVTGAPRLPPGGLAALKPKLTIVCKESNRWADSDLPSVMTCANYLKLPCYSSKEVMRERVLYAITEGQGSFHLS